jgi:hypothetical protein
VVHLLVAVNSNPQAKKVAMPTAVNQTAANQTAANQTA